MASKKQPDLEESTLAVLSKDAPDDPDAPLDPDAVLDDDGTPIPDEWQFESGEVDVDKVGIPLTVDGMHLHAYKPSPTAWLVLLSSVRSAATQADRGSSVLEFLQGSLDEQSWALLYGRIMSRTNPLDPELLGKVSEKLIQTWAPSNRAQRRAQKQR